MLDRKGTWLIVLVSFLVDQAVDGDRLAVAEIDAGAGGTDKEVGQIDRFRRCDFTAVCASGAPSGNVNWVDMFMPMSPFSSTYLTVLSMTGSSSRFLDGAPPYRPCPPSARSPARDYSHCSNLRRRWWEYRKSFARPARCHRRLTRFNGEISMLTPRNTDETESEVVGVTD